MTIDEMVEPDALAVGSPIDVYLLDFMLRYSALCTVESLSLLYLLFISYLYVLGDNSLMS